MHLWICVCLVMSTYFISANGHCCGATVIGYSVKRSPYRFASCEDIPGGEGKDHVDNDGVFNDILSKANRRKPPCRIEVCNDGQAHEGTYCATGSCNMFGCNCAGNCFGGYQDALQNFRRLYGSMLKYSRVLAWYDVYLP